MELADLEKRSAHLRLRLRAQGQRQGVGERDCSLTDIFKCFVWPQPCTESSGWVGRRGAALASAFPAIQPQLPSHLAAFYVPTQGWPRRGALGGCGGVGSPSHGRAPSPLQAGLVGAGITEDVLPHLHPQPCVCVCVEGGGVCHLASGPKSPSQRSGGTCVLPVSNSLQSSVLSQTPP